MTMMPASAVMSFLKSGDVRALAVTTKERSPLAPEVPTFAEQGFPGYEVVEELALFAPAGTPEPILRRLNEATAAAFATPEVQKRLAVLAVAPAVGRLEDWPAYIAAENHKWREVIRTRNITLNDRSMSKCGTDQAATVEGSSWVSGCWRQSRGVRPSNLYPITNYVFPSRLLVVAMTDIVH